MRLEHTGHDRVEVATPPDGVRSVLSDLAELRALVDGLVHDSSTTTRWVMARVRVGPIELSPAVDLDLASRADGLSLTGRPAPGHTPSWLDHQVRLEAVGSDATLVVTTWRVRVDVPGPQVFAAGLRPLLTNGARSISGQLARRLVARFDPA